MRNAFTTSAILAVLLAPSLLGVLPAHAEGAGPVTPQAATPAPQPDPAPYLRCPPRPTAEERKAAEFRGKLGRIDARIERLKGYIDEKQERLKKLQPDSREAEKLDWDIRLNRAEIERQQEQRRGLEFQQRWTEDKRDC